MKIRTTKNKSTKEIYSRRKRNETKIKPIFCQLSNKEAIVLFNIFILDLMSIYLKHFDDHLVHDKLQQTRFH